MSEIVKYHGAEIERVSAAQSGLKIRSISNTEPLNQALRYVIALIGLKKENMPSDANTAVIVDYINHNLGEFTIEEIRLAFTLGVAKKLTDTKGKILDMNHYQSFNAIYITDVMYAYREYVKNNRLNVKPQPVETKPTPEQIDKMLRDGCVSCFNEYVETGNINDYGSARYSYIVDRGFINLTPEQALQNRKDAEATIKVNTQDKLSVTMSRDLRLILQDWESRKPEGVICGEADRIALRHFFDSLIEDCKHISEIL